MKNQPEFFSQVVARERGRNRLMAVTLTAGVAGLATAGVIAYNLPAPAHPKTVSSSTAITPTPSASPVQSYFGDDGGEGGGSTSGAKGSSHATSGGS